MEKEIQSYIATFSIPQQQRMAQLHEWLVRNCPSATVKISWGMPTFVYYGNLIHFAQQKNHLGIYPGEHGVSMFTNELDALHLKYSKGAIRLPDDQAIPYPLLEKILRYRILENEEWENEKQALKRAKLK